MVEADETCDNGFEVARYCINRLSGMNACVDVDGDGTFTCTPLPGLDEACLAGRRLAVEATCDDATNRCVAWPGLGEPCPDYACAEGLECGDTGVCEATAPDAPLTCAP